MGEAPCRHARVGRAFGSNCKVEVGELIVAQGVILTTCHREWCEDQEAKVAWITSTPASKYFVIFVMLEPWLLKWVTAPMTGNCLPQSQCRLVPRRHRPGQTWPAIERRRFR